ncbi:hypothetical protein C5167_047294 [Papaver somniferum]|uniref:BHLH domain-containing protein n=1 Tax=Papaver somniferum TaxID=3469 RepID=A0A4Y7LK13_PAPSO|nr:transcription factor bHLH51-like [Papaver somniferum]RZC84509.1 hypothetical protein C5167_047294 [Papaver somniferum]
MHPQVQADAPTSNNSCSSSTSHSLAEKRRRQRINSHLSALKRLVPHSDKKMDKGSLLGCVVDHLKELKRSLLGEIIHQGSTIPNESDEIIVDHMTASTTTIGATTNNNNNDTGNSDCSNKGKYNEIYLKATVSCEDRPQLFMDLIDALKGLKMLRTIRTDIVTLGGRITLNIVLINIDNHESSGNINCLNSLKQSLRAVLGRVITPPSSSHWISTSGFSSKRQRLLFPQHHSHFSW